MRKIAYLLMVLMVAFIAASCEREAFDNKELDTDILDPEIESAEAEVAKFYGLWTRTTNYPEEYHFYMTRSDWEWRFYESGRSKRWIGEYKGDVLSGFTSNIFLYELKDDQLIVKSYYAESDDDVIAFDYSFSGDELTLSTVYEGETIVWSFTKTEDKDDRLVGDWSAIIRRGSNDEYIERHYAFETPTYGHIYEVTYNSTGTSSLGTQELGTFRYYVEGDTIYISPYGSDGYSPYFYYRLEGTKLYLRTSRSGEEVMYSNFKAENNIPYN